ncbi:MAG: hypothetical protein KDB22_20915 [Planctomycetales bacterium]|nr:hypothetical protein [Planctomycetales bacterium]
MSNEEGTRDISRAPGLVHLRATLVDDKYFQWKTWQRSSATTLPADWVLLQFCQEPNCVELWFNPVDGQIVSPQTRTRVYLIDSSKQAMAAYLSKINGSTPGVSGVSSQ